MPVGPLAAAEFAALIGRLGPFEPAPLLAVAVSGGADSMALCLLADEWARGRDGCVLALVVDHGLRAESACEARTARTRLAARGVEVRILGLTGLAHGAALASRARAARLAALERACAERGALHLLLGHHAGDQAETRLIREQAGSGPAGLACMAALRETDQVRVLRPLLSVAPERLRATLVARGESWVEDPSNRDSAGLRVRLRPAARAGRDALCAATGSDGCARRLAEIEVAAELAAVAIRPEGFAVVRGPALGPEAWSALIQMIGGASYAPSVKATARLSERPLPCTLASVRVAPAGRLGPGLLVAREEAAMAPLAPARDGVLWDGRFRVCGEAAPGATIGALAADAATMRDRSDLPAAVLRTLPAIRTDGVLTFVPHLHVGRELIGLRVAFDPPRPAACAPFMSWPQPWDGVACY